MIRLLLLILLIVSIPITGGLAFVTLGMVGPMVPEFTFVMLFFLLLNLFAVVGTGIGERWGYIGAILFGISLFCVPTSDLMTPEFIGTRLMGLVLITLATLSYIKLKKSNTTKTRK